MQLCFRLTEVKFNMQIWWNRQTRYFEVVVPSGVRLQVHQECGFKSLRSADSSISIYAKLNKGIECSEQLCLLHYFYFYIKIKICGKYNIRILVYKGIAYTIAVG